MKVAMLTGSLSRLGGGVHEIVKYLSKELSRQGLAIGVFGLLDDNYASDRDSWTPLEPRAFEPWGPGAFGYASGMAQALADFEPDIVHQHGLWMYPSLLGSRLRRRRRVAHVVTAQGMLDPWSMKHHQWRKALAWALFERGNLNGAHCINANSEPEAARIRELGLRAPICIIPNGVELPRTSTKPGQAPWAGTWGPECKVLLFLGRLHPKKGLGTLVRAWSLASSRDSNPGWRLAICGWEQGGHGAEIQSQIRALGLTSQVSWFGPAFGEAKAAALRASNAFILPSHGEGLPMAILEAWANALPAIMTRECNLTVGFSARAAIEIRPEVESIADGLQRLWSTPMDELVQMGLRGRELVMQRYTWQRVASDFAAVYAWLHGDAGRPNCVLL